MKVNFNTQYVLFKILQLCGADVIEEEFIRVENRNWKALQRKNWETVCSEASKKYPEIYYIN